MTSQTPSMEHKASESHIEIVMKNEDASFSSVSDEGFSTPPPTPPLSTPPPTPPLSLPPTPPLSPPPTPPFVDDVIYDDDEEPTQPPQTRRRIGDGEYSPNNLDISNSNNEPAATFVCEICADDKSSNESFGVKTCSHSYCIDCIKNYVLSKLQENITSISCPFPDCKGSLDPEYCRPVLPPEMVERWESALRENMIAVSQRFYCPYKDCSTMLDVTQVVTESECPNCKRMFCAQCKVAWHAEIGCEEFQKLNENEREKEDIMLRKLAREMRWSRCPSCKFYVEKTCGCEHVRCRCGSNFNYKPGKI